MILCWGVRTRHQGQHAALGLVQNMVENSVSSHVGFSSHQYDSVSLRVCCVGPKQMPS